MSYKPYDEAISSEQQRGLWQPADDRDLLVPVRPLPGVYTARIWDVIEAGSKAIFRLDLGNSVLFDWELWAFDRAGGPSWIVQQLGRKLGINVYETNLMAFVERKLGEIHVDSRGQVGWKD